MRTERTILQCLILTACLVPITAGISGMLVGSSLIVPTNVTMDSHFRYLSGLLAGIGIAIAIAVPRIEQHSTRFQLLTTIVVLGGIGRLIGLIRMGTPDITMQFALVMELVVTPSLYFWQRSYTRRLALQKSPN